VKLRSLESISATRSSGVLHPLLRALLYLTAYTFGTLGVAVLAIALLAPLSDRPVAQSTVMAGMTLAIVVGTTYLFRRFLDQRSLASMGLALPGALRLTLRGAAIGGLLVTLPVLAQLPFGTMALSESTSPTSTIVAWGAGIFVWLAFSAMAEEIVSRGYLLQNLAAGTTVPLGVAGSSAVFAVLHLANPNVSWIAVLNILLAGVFFSLYYLLEGTLWGPFGAHLAWNFAQGYVLGLPVSGITIFERNPIFDFEPGDPAWLTGGSFGPEGGAAITAVLLAASLVMLAVIYRKARTRKGE
jgi:membrane protease YdiL (CAAX protease family)